VNILVKRIEAGWNTILVVACVAALCTSCALVPTRPPAVPYGFITSTYEQYSADLVGENGLLKLTGGTTKAKVLAGEYKLVACTFDETDAQGVTWRIAGKGDLGSPPLKIDAGKTVPLMFGPPLKASVVTSKAGDVYRLGLSIVGQSGETYSARDIKRGGGQPSPPRFEVWNEKGDVVARGQFEYG